MSRTVRDAKIDTRAARQKLPSQPQPFWRSIDKGLSLGYRKLQTGGTWVARRYLGNQTYVLQSIGTADDLSDADGARVLNFHQAQKLAREVAANAALAGSHGPYTVRSAIEAYLAARERRGSKGVRDDRQKANARIIPILGHVQLAKLTAQDINGWLDAIGAAKRFSRAPHGGRIELAKDNPTNADAVRKRRASANRYFTILRAALNYAFHNGKIDSDVAWRRVKPFRDVGAPTIRFLSVDECRLLVAACESDFANLVAGALATGCRYGELIRLQAKDLNKSSGTLSIQISKSGKARHVVLSADGVELFEKAIEGLIDDDLIFTRFGGEPWTAGQQKRRLAVASKTAGITPPARFHLLRHTYASVLAMAGVPMPVIAAQLGHASTAMTEKHYAHLSKSYVAETVRAKKVLSCSRPVVPGPPNNRPVKLVIYFLLYFPVTAV